MVWHAMVHGMQGWHEECPFGNGMSGMGHFGQGEQVGQGWPGLGDAVE